MSNVTLSIDDDLLDIARAYASRHRISVNALVRHLLEKTVRPGSAAWVDACFARMDQPRSRQSRIADSDIDSLGG
ncbi:MAG: hypothetical protein H0W83_13060 [Planctomycetes bacterium]|nr:hypothetical protein [Planctomycetota bacterium]